MCSLRLDFIFDVDLMSVVGGLAGCVTFRRRGIVFLQWLDDGVLVRLCVISRACRRVVGHCC